MTYVVELASAQSKGGGRTPSVTITLDGVEVRPDADGNEYTTVAEVVDFLVGGQFKIRRVRREGEAAQR
jgi:hypothetical protein